MSEVPPVQKTPVRGVQTATGLANQVQAREAEAGILNQVEATKGHSPEQLQQRGRKIVEATPGYDIEGLAKQVARGEAELTPDNVGVLLEGKRRLIEEVNVAAGKLEKSRTPKGIEAYTEAKQRLQDFVENVQAGKGRWSDVGRALQAGTELDTGNFAEVLVEAKRHGVVSQAMEKQLRAATGEVERLRGETARLQGELTNIQANAAVKTRAPRFSKTDVHAEIDSLLEEFKSLKGKPGVRGGKQAGAIAPPDLDILGKQAVIIAKLGKAYVKLGAANLEEVVVRVQAAMKDRLGVTLDRQEIIDALARKGVAPTRSEFTQRMSELRTEARRLSTEAKLKKDAAEKLKITNRVAELKSQIADMQKQLETGKFRIPDKAERKITQEIANLEAERNVYSTAVKAHIEHLGKTRGQKTAEALTSVVRGTILGSDVGTVSRQSFILGKGHPIQLAKSIYQGLRAVKSEVGLERVMSDLRNSRIGDTSALVVRKRAGLSLSDSLSHPEEIVAGKILQYVPGLKRLLGKPLERFQLAQLNSLRAGVFDAAARKGWSDAELANLARFINNVSGRGNVKGVPKMMQSVMNVVMTSPRYEISRWGSILETVRQPAWLAKGLVTGKLDRSAAMAVKDMGATVAWVIGVYKMAELAGYKTSLDPTSSDFLKLRKGKDVWDISAGLVPRIRTLIAAYQAFRNPDYKANWKAEIGKAVTRTISPALVAPGKSVSVISQRIDGKPESKITDPISGFVMDEREKSFWAYAPLIFQSIKQAEEEGSPTDAAWAGVREFLGSSVSRYEKSKKVSLGKVNTTGGR